MTPAPHPSRPIDLPRPRTGRPPVAPTGSRPPLRSLGARLGAPLLVAATLAPGVARGQSATSTVAALPPDVEVIRVVGEAARARRIAGSAHLVDATELKRFEYDDVGRALVKVPGVYVRDEDGFGLRPNIGIRGANSDRSAKIVLLEDGVLLGLAPYSAPAAYFVPLMTRMEGLEVFKGPAAVRTGPFTVGGAVNYVTADVPYGAEGLLDVAGGRFGYMKGHGRYGWGNESFGFLLEGVRLTSSGFKELDGGGDTGFEKNEAMLKVRASTDPLKRIVHRLDLKLGYADEVSNETYLGLTQEDFRADPYRRYRASALGRMEWERTQAEIAYTLFVDDLLEARLVGYRHDFSRAWFKLNSFAESAPVDDPRRYQSGDNPREFLGSGLDAEQAQRLDVLRGRVASTEVRDPLGLLRIGTNDRQFISQGLQLDGELRLGDEGVEQRLRFGARLHFDQVERLHTEQTWRMEVLGDELGNLVREPEPIDTTREDRESALAFSAYLQDDLTLFQDLVLSPGVRVEVIRTESERFGPGARPRIDNEYAVLIPGFGAYYQLTDALGILAGVHRGFSPLAPGQDEAVEIESSINYEGGFRYRRSGTSAEVIGFFADYSNLLLTCTFSQGCEDVDVGKQFNAGSVFVYGLEALATQSLSLPGSSSLDLSASYTLTLSELRAFDPQARGNPQFENAQPGDELPYLPTHQGNLTATWGVPLGRFADRQWLGRIALSYTFVDRMRDSASAGTELPDELFTDAQHLLDLSAQVETGVGARVYLLVNNLLDQAYIASRRPFGARPGAPLNLQVGVGVPL